MAQSFASVRNRLQEKNNHHQKRKSANKPKLSSATSEEDPESLFKLEDKLGRGYEFPNFVAIPLSQSCAIFFVLTVPDECRSYGKVFKAIYLPENKEVALKVMILQPSEMNGIGKLKSEINFLASMKSPYIVEYYGSWLVPETRTLWVFFLAIYI